MIKHATASAFIFSNTYPHGWRLGLIEHPLRRRYMITGGHVETDETPHQAALREATEESGVRVRLIACPAARAALTPPAFSPHIPLPLPWWMVAIEVPFDNYISETHIHVDHQYVAIADAPSPVQTPDHPFDWYSSSDLDDLHMFPDTRMQARLLFPIVSAVEDVDDDYAACFGLKGTE